MMSQESESDVNQGSYHFFKNWFHTDKIMYVQTQLIRWIKPDIILYSIYSFVQAFALAPLE